MSNLRPSVDSRLSETLLEPHRAPEPGTSLPPSTPPPDGGGLVAGGVVVVVVLGAGLVVVVAGLVVVVVAGGAGEAVMVDPGSCSQGSAARRANPSSEAVDVPVLQSQPPLADSEYTIALTFGIEVPRARTALPNQRALRPGSAGSSVVPVPAIMSGLPQAAPAPPKTWRTCRHAAT